MKTDQGNVGVIVLDVQGDFTQLADGALAVEGTDRDWVDQVSQAVETLKRAGLPIFGTQDWHPRQHISFFTNHDGKKAFDVITIEGRQQVLWPPHCVQGTKGANLLVDERLFDEIVKKGTDKRFDSYSGFQDDGGHRTRLHQILQTRGISQVVVFGIATDYCVKATALDAADLGYVVILIENLTRGVDLETSKNALKEMEQKGITLLDEVDLKRITP
ncbi:MAG: bifunctional nicotinamidase/pyrazinamidase [Proteobacteria bacterium]|nr:bifunctional nicotinamidase/pyrazinamidase [Pseudomonadota bacterium]